MNFLPETIIEIIEVIFMYAITVVIGGSLYYQHKNKEKLNKIHLLGFILVIFMSIMATITLIVLL